MTALFWGFTFCFGFACWRGSERQRDRQHIGGRSTYFRPAFAPTTRRSDWCEWVCLFGVLNNPVFLAIVGTTFVLQIGIMQFFYHMFTVLPLSLNQWIVCIVRGSNSCRANESTSVSSCVASVRPPTNGTATAWPA